MMPSTEVNIAQDVSGRGVTGLRLGGGFLGDLGRSAAARLFADTVSIDAARLCKEEISGTA